MSRIVQVSLPPEHTINILPKIEKLDGLISLSIQKNSSLKPKGDVITFELINSEVTIFFGLMEKEGLLLHNDVSITTSRPTNIISKSSSDKILSESHETSWEDLLKSLLHESNMTYNAQLIMFISGVVAAIGISVNSLHVVIGAMLIAPGFEPISRMMLGIVTQHRDWKNGGRDIIKGYFVLILGGIVGALTIDLIGQDVIPGSSTYLPSGALVKYWSTITATSIIVSILASIAGGIIIMTNKSLLTAGVMVALALIPSASLIGMTIVEGEIEMAGKVLFRLFLEIIIVAVFSGLIFLWKRLSIHKRRMRV